MSLTILPIQAFRDNYIWTVLSTDGQRALCIDPGDADPVFSTLKEKNLELAGILVTHHHWDHTNGISALLLHYPVPVYGPANSPVQAINKPVSDAEVLSFPEFEMELEVLSIPGHTLDHIAYYDGRRLFCGDTLFSAGCGRLFEGSAEQMHQSLQRLARLPDETEIYCAHEYTEANLRFAQSVEPGNKIVEERLNEVHQLRRDRLPTIPSTLAIERLTNPFLRTQTPTVKLAAEKYANSTLATDEAVFSTIRDWKNHF